MKKVLTYHLPAVINQKNRPSGIGISGNDILGKDVVCEEILMMEIASTSGFKSENERISNGDVVCRSSVVQDSKFNIKKVDVLSREVLDWESRPGTRTTRTDQERQAESAACRKRN